MPKFIRNCNLNDWNSGFESFPIMIGRYENILHAMSAKSEKSPIDEKIFDGNLRNNFHFQ